MMAAALVCALVGAAPAHSAPRLTVYSAPAGDRPAGAPQAGHPYDVILPNGRIVAPVGRSTVVGMDALGVALSPDGKYAIVSNDDERQADAVSAIDPKVRGGYTLAVVETSTMRVTDVFTAAQNWGLWVGVVALKDPKNPSQTLVVASGGPTNLVHFFHLSAAGTLQKESSYLAIPAPTDPHYANQNHAFPGSITLSADRRVAYVVNNLADSVTAIDLATRSVMHSAPVGFFPYGIALAGNRLYVTDPGLMRYGVLPQPVRVPQFANVAASPQNSSALTAVRLTRNGDVAGGPTQHAQMDQMPDGRDLVGGAAPTAIVASKDGRYAFVCMTNVDRIAVVSLRGLPRVVGGIQLRLFDKAPYGTQPNAIVRSPDGKRLYVALAGMNAVAVLDSHDPLHLHRLGLIPTGWYPTALAVSSTGRYLYVANAKGFGQEPHFEGAPPYKKAADGHVYQSTGDSNTIWATLQRIDLHKLPLPKTTMSALRYTRTAQVAPDDAVVPPLRSLKRSSVIKHVVFILEENKTYDSMLGDLKDGNGAAHGNGDASLVSYGESITPNLHALAREFGLATNLYADGDESDAGHQFAAGGVATAYSEKTLLVKSGRSPNVNKNEDPEDYPRAGYIFNSVARAGMTYRDYGDLIRLSGYDEGGAQNPKADDPDFKDEKDASAPTNGLGGLYSLDVPAPAVLGGHVDLNYPGWNLHIRDARRAQEFVKDYGAFAQAGGAPDFTYIWLPDDHGGFGPNIPPLPEEVADGDRALGSIVDYLTHQPDWPSTAIFIMPDDAQSSRDHVSEHRTYAIVVSPYVKRHYVSDRHTSTVSVLKTEEELLGLPPLALNDLLATDLSDFFGATPDTTPYSAIRVPTQTASVEGRRIAALLARTDQSGPDADVERSARIIALSRQADELSARRTVMAPHAYAAAQHSLYQAALQALQSTKSDND
jgi:YVTN family beta-propeller protein